MIELAQHARSLFGIHLTSSQLRALERYQQELLEWNLSVNLTAIDDPEQVRIKHFLDSLSCLCVMGDLGAGRLVDVGTGAGFPGLPIKILYPSLRLTLIESVGKKADFCRHIVRTLNLEGVQVVRQRAEAAGHMDEHREAYDWSLARAVAVLPVLSEYLLPLTRVGGAMIAMKGESAPAETHAAEHAIRLLGGHVRKLVPITLPGVAEQRFLVVIDKVAATPGGYPRRVGIPAKKPLK